MSGSDLLVVDALSASWGPTPVLHGISFRVADSELVVLMGPNGSGKTTLLRCLAALEPVTGGSVRLAGRALDGVPTHRRGIGMLAQEPAMFAGRTVAENVAYGLELARLPRPETERRVGELLDLLEIRPLAQRRPEQLSGGERQRVALARTLAPRPKLVLLDEPFASVDEEFRETLRADFRRVLGEERVAGIHVTHDREEGLFLADRVLILLDGEIRQSGRPEEVYNRPATPEVATFLGYNLLRTPAGVEAVHPERLRVVEASHGRALARVTAVGTVGLRTELHLRLPDGHRALSRILAGAPGAPVGSTVGLDWEASAAWPA